MCMAYDRMSKSKLTFLITNSRDSGKRDGSVYITKAAVRLKRDNCNALFYKPKVPTFINSLGHIFYLYPHFVLHVGNKKRISAIPYLNFGMRYYERSYTLAEDQKVPRDAEVIGRGYKYVNKDGSLIIQGRDGDENRKFYIDGRSYNGSDFTEISASNPTIVSAGVVSLSNVIIKNNKSPNASFGGGAIRFYFLAT